jgi:hypothetical protein
MGYLRCLVLTCVSLVAVQSAHAQSCPPEPQARALQARGDALGAYCLSRRQFDFAREKCSASKDALDLDECQYLSELLIRDLPGCVAMGGAYGAKCATMLAESETMHQTATDDPALVEHRREQVERNAPPCTVFYPYGQGNVGVKSPNCY